MNTTKYRVYADGTVVHEDGFAEYDNSIPYYDDYIEIEVDESVDEETVASWELQG